MAGDQHPVVVVVSDVLILLIKNAVEVFVNVKGEGHLLPGHLLEAVELILSGGQGENRHHHIRTAAAVAAEVKDDVFDRRVFRGLPEPGDHIAEIVRREGAFPVVVVGPGLFIRHEGIQAEDRRAAVLPVGLVPPGLRPHQGDGLVAQLLENQGAFQVGRGKAENRHLTHRGVRGKGRLLQDLHAAGEDGVPVAQIDRKQPGQGRDIFPEIRREQAGFDGEAVFPEIGQGPVQALFRKRPVQHGLSGMAEEVVEVEAEIRIALADKILRAFPALHLGLQLFGFKEALHRSSLQIKPQRIQVLAVIEQVVGGNVRHHVGQDRDRQIDVVPVRVHCDPVFGKVQGDRGRLALKVNGRDAGKTGGRVLPAQRLVFQREGQVEKAVPVRDGDLPGRDVAEQLFPDPVFHGEGAVLLHEPERLMLHVLRIRVQAPVGDMGRLVIKAQRDLVGLLSVDVDDHRNGFLGIRRAVRRGRHGQGAQEQKNEQSGEQGSFHG